MLQIRNFPNFKIYGNVAEQIWNCGFKNMEILNGTFQTKSEQYSLEKNKR